MRSATQEITPGTFRPYNTAMLKKKVLTVACAIAIVATGACFLPPEHVPPPPLPPYLVQVRTFAIQVQDASGKDLIDGDAMSRAVASNFNELWKDYSVRARPFQPSGHTEATLRITLARKSASGSSTEQGKQRWNFELSASSTLTAPDGRLLWQEQDENSHFTVRLENGLPPDGWNSRIVMKQSAYSLAMVVGEKIFHIPHSN